MRVFLFTRPWGKGPGTGKKTEEAGNNPKKVQSRFKMVKFLLWLYPTNTVMGLTFSEPVCLVFNPSTNQKKHTQIDHVKSVIVLQTWSTRTLWPHKHLFGVSSELQLLRIGSSGRLRNSFLIRNRGFCNTRHNICFHWNDLFLAARAPSTHAMSRPK